MTDEQNRQRDIAINKYQKWKFKLTPKEQIDLSDHLTKEEKQTVWKDYMKRELRKAKKSRKRNGNFTRE